MIIPKGMHGVWGVSADPAKLQAFHSTFAATPEFDFKPKAHYRYCRTCDDQGHTSSCSGHGGAGYLDMLILAAYDAAGLPPPFAQGVGLDWNVLWRAGKALDGEQNRDKDVGVSDVKNVLLGARDELKLFGAQPVTIKEVGFNFADQNAAIQDGPMLTGVNLSRGCFPESCDPDSGDVDESQLPSVLECMGHCMVDVAHIQHPTKPEVQAVVRRGSWGRFYAYMGYMLTTVPFSQRMYMFSGPYQLLGWDPVADTSWKKYVVRTQ